MQAQRGVVVNMYIAASVLGDIVYYIDDFTRPYGHLRVVNVYECT